MIRIAGLCLVFFASCAADPHTWTADFEGESNHRAPMGWEVAETNGVGMPGAWVVHEENGAKHVCLAETKNTRHTYNVLFAPGTHPADVVVKVRSRAETGEEDQGGGVVWRAQDADNYYITRWNPLEDNLRAYKVVDGKRTELASATLSFAPGWHELEVLARGSKILISFDGVLLLQLEDETFAGGGRVGLWTKADASTSFDDFRVSAIQ